MACDELHALCSSCKVRGHRKEQACGFQAAYRQKFHHFKRFGFRTHRAASEDSKWGYKPSDNLDVKAGNLSDVEVEKGNRDIATYLVNRKE